MRKRGWRRGAERRRLVRDWKESGETAIAFAKRIGVASNTLYRWRAALASAPSGVSESSLSRIVEVRAAVVPAGAHFEIDVGSRRVRVPAAFDEEGLRRLLRVLEVAL
jgi:transposase-like protein